MKLTSYATRNGPISWPLLSLILLFFSCFFGCSVPQEGRLTSDPPPEEETFQPVTFSEDHHLDFSDDSRLDFGNSGTVEILFKTLISKSEASKASSYHDTLANYVLVSNSDDTQTRFAIFLNKNLSRIGMYNGTHFASLRHDFQDKQWHHVAFSTHDDHTVIIVDDQQIGTIPITYGAGQGLPLHIGTLNGNKLAYSGEMYTVRLWDQPLGKEEIAQNKFYGKVFVDDDYVNSLVAYTMFTNQRQDFHYTNEPIEWTGAVNRTQTDIQELIVPSAAKVRKLMVRLDNEMILSVGLQYEISEQGPSAVKNAWFPHGSDELDEGEIREFELFPEIGETLIGISGTFDQGMALKSMRFITNWRNSALFSTGKTGEFPYLIRIPVGNKFGGFQGEGMDGSELLQSIGLGYKTDSFLPLQNLGLFTHELDGEPIRNDHFVRNNLLEHKDPRNGNMHLHGNYTSYPVFHFQHELQNDFIVVKGEFPAAGFTLKSKTKSNIKRQGTGISASASGTLEGVTMGGNIGGRSSSSESQEDFESSFQPASVFGPEVFHYDNNFRYVHENGSILTMIDADSYQLEASEGFPMRSGVYRYARPYQIGDEDKKDPWGATFTLDQRPQLAEFNFRGYNIAKLDHQNYQLGTGTSKKVFKWPDDASRNYQYTTNGKILPYGIFYRNDREAMQRARSHTISTEHQHQQAWNINLGVNIGVPGMSFGLSGSHNESVQRMRQTKKMNALSMAFEAKYALVMDKTHIQLDPDFRKAVYRLRDLYLSYGQDTLNTDNFSTGPFGVFIQTFGSHYPYAVTYGGMAYQEIALTATTKATIKAQGTKINASASGTMEGVTLGGNIGGGFSSSDELKNAMDNQRTHTRTIGGELSMGGQGGSWSLPEHSEVPVLLDLRPIYELLSPVYFEDTIIWRTLRHGLKTTLEKHADTYSWRDESWDAEPGLKQFAVKFHFFENINAGDGLYDAASEYFGSITVNDETAWCVHAKSDLDDGCPPPTELPNQFAATLAGRPINRMPIHFEKIYEVSKEDYCSGSLTIDIELHEDDGPNNSDDYGNFEIVHHWKNFPTLERVEGLKITKDIGYGGTEVNIFYSIIAEPNNWTCPNN